MYICGVLFRSESLSGWGVTPCHTPQFLPVAASIARAAFLSHSPPTYVWAATLHLALTLRNAPAALRCHLRARECTTRVTVTAPHASATPNKLDSL